MFARLVQFVAGAASLNIHPPVTLQRIEDLSPGEVFMILDYQMPAVGFLAHAPSSNSPDDQPVMVLLNGHADGYPELVWPHQLNASSVLSLGNEARVHFDPASTRIRLAASGLSCEGCLIIRRSGVFLRVPERRGGMRAGSRDVPIGSSRPAGGVGSSGDVAIPDWELRLPPDDPGGSQHVLYRFTAKP